MKKKTVIIALNMWFNRNAMNITHIHIYEYLLTPLWKQTVCASLGKIVSTNKYCIYNINAVKYEIKNFTLGFYIYTIH